MSSGGPPRASVGACGRLPPGRGSSWGIHVVSSSGCWRSRWPPGPSAPLGRRPRPTAGRSGARLPEGVGQGPGRTADHERACGPPHLLRPARHRPQRPVARLPGVLRSRWSSRAPAPPIPLRGAADLEIVVFAFTYDLNGRPTYRPANLNELVNVSGFTRSARWRAAAPSRATPPSAWAFGPACRSGPSCCPARAPAPAW